MKWRKANDGLPNTEVCIRYNSDGKMIYDSSNKWDCDILKEFDCVEWLDESVSDGEKDKEITNLKEMLARANSRVEHLTNMLNL